MSHTVHPYSHRLGIIRDWKSRWFAPQGKYQEYLKSDVLLREFIEKKLKGFFVSKIEIERTVKALNIFVETSRPGMIIGRSGEGSAKLKKEVASFVSKNRLAAPKDINIDIRELRSPESNSAIVAQMIAEGLEKRLPFRRVVKQIIEKVMANRDVQGVKINLSGRLGGADMARRERLKKGRVPLQTFRSDIDFARQRAILPYGAIGIKVWIYKGDVFSDNQVAKRI